MDTIERGNLVKSIDGRDEVSAIFVVLEAGINHVSGPVARIALHGQDDQPVAARMAIYRLEANLLPVVSV